MAPYDAAAVAIANTVMHLPITKARINLGALVKRTHLGKEYFIIGKDGIPIAGLMDIDELEDYLELKDPASGVTFNAAMNNTVQERVGLRTCYVPNFDKGKEEKPSPHTGPNDGNFQVRTTPHFGRLVRHSHRHHGDLAGRCAEALETLQAGPLTVAVATPSENWKPTGRQNDSTD